MAVLALVASAHADVTMKEKTVSTGMAGFGNTTSERTVVIAGDRSRIDEQSTYTGRLKTFAGGGKPRTSATIVRLDRDLIWSLDLDKKQYTEMTFAQMREMTEQGLAQAKQELDKPGNKQASDVKVDYKVDVQKTGKRDRVNGFDAEEYIVTLTTTMTGKSEESGESQTGSYTMKMDEWAAENLPGRDETLAYYRRFGEKLGLDPQMQGVLSAMSAQYKEGFKHMAGKMKEIKGTPVRTTITTTFGAELTPEQQAKMDKARAEQKEQQKERAENKQKQEQAEESQAKENAAGSLAHGNIGGALGGMLGHRLGKAAEKKAESGASSGDAGGSQGSGLTITVDVLGITTGASGTSFDLPAGFTRAERKTH